MDDPYYNREIVLTRIKQQETLVSFRCRIRGVKDNVLQLTGESGTAMILVEVDDPTHAVPFRELGQNLGVLHLTNGTH